MGIDKLEYVCYTLVTTKEREVTNMKVTGTERRTMLGFIISKYYDKKQEEEERIYSEFYGVYEAYNKKIAEQISLKISQEEIQKQIEKEQSIANCFPAGADYNARIKKIDELRYSYLCKQGSIDIVKMERKELAAKLNAVSLKPEYLNHIYK